MRLETDQFRAGLPRTLPVLSSQEMAPPCLGGSWEVYSSEPGSPGTAELKGSMRRGRPSRQVAVHPRALAARTVPRESAVTLVRRHRHRRWAPTKQPVPAQSVHLKEAPQLESSIYGESFQLAFEDNGDHWPLGKVLQIPPNSEKNYFQPHS